MKSREISRIEIASSIAFPLPCQNVYAICISRGPIQKVLPSMVRGILFLNEYTSGSSLMNFSSMVGMNASFSQRRIQEPEARIACSPELSPAFRNS